MESGEHPPASALGGVTWVYRKVTYQKIVLTACLSLAEQGNLPGVLVIESPRYQVKGILRESLCA